MSDQSPPGPPFPPPSISRTDYLRAGSDGWFREVLYRMIQSADGLDRCREAFGREIGLTGNQYLVLMGVAYLEGAQGVGIAALAAHIGLAAPHVTTEAGRLARRGLLAKAPNPADGRGVLVSLSPEGRQTVRRVIALVRPVNDLLFEGIAVQDIEVARAVAERLAANTERALAELRRLQTATPATPAAPAAPRPPRSGPSDQGSAAAPAASKRAP